MTLDEREDRKVTMTEAIEEILASEIKTAEGKYPSQIVMRQVKPKTFATHLKVLPPEREPFYILGRYFTKRDEAEADFHKRVQELEGP
jgi:hypothetical protein